MAEIYLTASLVVYKPDFLVLERTLYALHQALIFARQKHMLRFELTLVDNSDDQDWAERIENWVAGRESTLDGWKISILNPGSNLGYGRGNNLVIDKIDSDYHLVINPDLFLEQDAFLQALGFMQNNHDVGLLVPSVFGQDGQRQYLCKRNPTLFIMFLRSFSPNWLRLYFKSMLDEFEMRECSYDEIIEGIEYPTGCCMFFRTKSLKQINGFDPDYFLHYEDADIGRRMLNVARIVYVPSFKVLHLWGRDTHHSWKFRLITVWSGLIYWSKWGGVFRVSNQNKLDMKQHKTDRASKGTSQ